jgi:hypothetical protein
MSVLSEFLTLIGVKTELSLQQEREKEQRKEQRRIERSQLAAQVKYESDSADAEDALSALRELPETESHCQQIENYLKAAKSKANAGDFLGAVDILRNVASEKQKAEKAAARVIKEAKATYAALFNRQKAIETAAAQDDLLSEEYQAKLHADLETLLSDLYRKPVERYTSEKVGETLETLAIVVARKQELQRTAKRNALAQRSGAESMVEELALVAPARETAAVRRELSVADTALAERDFARAHSVASEVLKTVGVRLQQLEAEKQDWDKLAKKLEPALSTCQEHMASKYPVLLAAPPFPSEITVELQSLKTTEVGKDMSYVDAAETLQRLLDQIELNEERVAAYGKLKEFRDAADDALDQKGKEVKAAFTELNIAIRRKFQKDNVSSLGEYQTRFENLQAEWNRAKQVALLETDLPRDKILTALGKLLDEVKEMTENPGKYEDELSEIVHQDELRKERPKYEKARQLCRAALDKLEPYAAPEYPALEKRFKELVAQCEAVQEPDGFVRPLKALAELKEEVKAAQEAIATTTKDKQTAAKKEFGRLSGLLARYNETVEQYKGSFLTDSPEYEKYADLLTAELADLEGLVDSDDNDLLDSAVKDMEVLKKRLMQAINGLEKGDSKSSEPSMQQLSKDIATQTALLKNQDLTTYLPDTKTALQDEIKAIKGGLLTTAMDESSKKLVAWLKKTREAIVQAGKARAEYKAFAKDQKKAVEDLTKAKEKFGGKDEYYNSLQKQLAALLDSGKAEGGLSSAVADLERLQQEIQKALTDPEAMNEGQQAAQKVIDEAENDESIWKAKYQDFKTKVLPKVKEAGALGKLYDEVVKLGEMAQQAFEKSKDRFTAEFQLNIARDRAKWVMEFPQGLDLAGRNKLPEVQKKWQDAVKDFKEGLASLLAKVEELEPTARPELETSLNKIGGLFNPLAFDAVIQEIIKPGVPFATKQGRREEGLAVVRRYKNYLVKDGRMKLLRENPFVKPFAGLNSIYNALLDVEKNLLISL